MATKKHILAWTLTINLMLAQSCVSISPAVAQAPAVPAPGESSGPIDIVANEQEFAGDHVIARGNVRVLFKDSVIVAPIATLYRDPATGQPQRAIFTGHPRLTQGNNKIDADVLTFEMATSKIVAEGHSHSEVINEAQPAAEPPKTAAASGGPVKWPGEKGYKEPVAKAKPDKVEKVAKVNEPDTTSGADEVDGDGQVIAKAPQPAKQPASTGNAPAGGDEAPTKIITDADRQEYDRQSGKFEAFGNVRVRAGDIHVLSDTLHMAYGVDTRPEAAIFKGHVNATQGKNNTQADHMTYFLNTKRLQATGHVRSKVIQTGKEGGPAKPATPAAQPEVEPLVNSKTGKMVNLLNGGGEQEAAPIIIVSDSQDYNKETGRLDATGSVKIFYQDTIGVGPKVVMTRNADGQAEKIVFVGRSQITQPGKRWIADKIVMTVADRRVLAEGNTKAYILQKKPGQNTPSQGSGNYALAGRKPTQQVSTTRINSTQ